MPNPYSTDQAVDSGAIPVRTALQNIPVLADLPTPPPASLPASAVWSSGAIPAAGYQAIAASAQIDRAGSLSLQRYIDAAGTLPIGAAITQAMTANVLATVFSNDGMPFASYIVSVTNSAGGTAHLINVYLLETA